MDEQRFMPDERIEVVRKTADSKEECEQLKAELESKGFTVTVREPAAIHIEGEYYLATLFAEKRETVMVDTWAVERERKKQRRRNRKIDITAKVGFWAIIVIALLLLFYFSGPLIYAVRALF